MPNYIGTHLQHVDTLSRDVRIDLVFVVKMTPEHLGRLVYRMLDLHGDTTTSLRFLDDRYLREQTNAVEEACWYPHREICG